MSKLKHIVAIFIVMGIIATAAYFLPQLESTLNIQSDDKNTNEVATDADTKELDTLSFLEHLKKELQVLSTSYSKRKKKEIWTLGKGQTIIMYLLEAQNYIQSKGGSILYMEELFDNNTVFQSATLDFLNPDGDTVNLELQISENVFRSNASMLAVAFQVTDITPEQIVELNKLDYPFTLLINPFSQADGFKADINRVKNKELFLWLYMESNKINKRHNKYRPIRIHHTEEQIEEIINDAMQAFPSAKGIATHFGEQAVEHKQLLQATFKPAEKNRLQFIDLSLNKMSKVMETCKEYKISCKVSQPYNPDNSTLADYVSQKLKDARKNGIAALVLPLTSEGMDKAESLQKKAQAQGTSIINLSTFISY